MPMYTIDNKCMHACMSACAYNLYVLFPGHNQQANFPQHYRNTRRRSADVIRKPKIQLQLHPSTAASSSGCAAIEQTNEDDEENVQALQKLATIRSPTECTNCADTAFCMPQGSID